MSAGSLGKSTERQLERAGNPSTSSDGAASQSASCGANASTELRVPESRQRTAAKAWAARKAAKKALCLRRGLMAQLTLAARRQGAFSPSPAPPPDPPNDVDSCSIADRIRHRRKRARPQPAVDSAGCNASCSTETETAAADAMASGSDYKTRASRAWSRRREERRAAGLPLGGGRDEYRSRASKPRKPGDLVFTKDPYTCAELRATRLFGFPSFGPVCWGGQTVYIPGGIVPEGMTCPPAAMAQLYGSALGLGAGPRPQQPPAADVSLLALRAIEGAFLERPHGPPHAAAAAPAPRHARLQRPLRRQAQARPGAAAMGALRPLVQPLPPGCPEEHEARHDFLLDRGAQTCLALGDEVAAVHLPGLFKEGDGLGRLAAAVACGAMAFPFAERPPSEDRALFEAARDASEAARRTGALDAMRARLAELGKSRGKTGTAGTTGGGPRGDWRLPLLNARLAGMLEYLLPALCAVDLAAACGMARAALALLGRQQFHYGFWGLQWMDGPDRVAPARAKRGGTGAGAGAGPSRSYTALVFFHPGADARRRLHRLRFPALGAALDLRHGDAVLVRVRS
eukprot:tig00021434_g21343.t1